MIDDKKTAQLRQKIQQEKGKIETSSTIGEVEDKASSALLAAAMYFYFYGAQFFLLSKLGYQPLNLIETVIVLFGLKHLFSKKP